MDNVETISTEVNVLGDFLQKFQNNGDSRFYSVPSHPSSQVSVLDQCPESEIMAIDTFMLWIETEFSELSTALRKSDLAILKRRSMCNIR